MIDTDQTTGRGTEPPEVFQYATLQLVPSAERNERINVGVILYSRRHRFLSASIAIDRSRVQALWPFLDIDAVEVYLNTLTKIADGSSDAGPITELSQSDRFGWLVAPSDTMIQATSVHTGLCNHPSATLDKLVSRLVAISDDNC